MAGFDRGNHHGTGEELTQQVMTAAGGAGAGGFHIFLISIKDSPN
jgi:hypothetical protein